MAEISSQQILENQEKILRNQELMLANESFWEHFTDHLIIGFSFFSLGFILCTYFILMMYKKRVRIDYDIEEGTIIRVERNNGKKLLIVRPANLKQLYDVILLSYFGKGNDKFIDKHDKRRIRIIGIVGLILVAVLMLSGFILLFSAFEFSVDIFDYL
jgi:hypothetical protein